MSQTKAQILNPLNGNLNVTGIVTATSFVGDGSGLIGVANTDFIVGTSITMTTGTFTGNVSIAGTLTYEDVTNVDSIGIVTARSGIQVLAGGIDAVGVVTATSFKGDGSQLSGVGGENDITSSLFI